MPRVAWQVTVKHLACTKYMPSEKAAIEKQHPADDNGLTELVVYREIFIY